MQEREAALPAPDRGSRLDALDAGSGLGTAEVRHGWLRIIIKSAKDLDGPRAVAFSTVLQQAWLDFAGQPTSVALIEPAETLSRMPHTRT
jgi:hypothetical protein